MNPKIKHERNRISEERPAMHAAPIHQENQEERVRLRKGDSAVDPLNIPDEIVAQFNHDYGLDLNWKRYEVHGKEDYTYMRGQEQQGWRPLLSNHPLIDGMFAPHGNTNPVIVEGMILMERPMKLSKEAKLEEQRKADHAVGLGHARMRETPEGQAPRMAPQINKHREVMSIPD